MALCNVVCFDFDEFQRWMAQSEHTLRSAYVDAKHEFYNWSCFKAHQAGEYSLKAILHGLGLSAIGHSVLVLLNLLSDQGIQIPDSLFADARALDRHYIPPRYADAYPSGSPFEFYDEQTACEALKASERVIEFTRKLKDSVTSDKEGASG